MVRIVYVGAWGTQHHLVDSWDMTLCGIPPTRTWRAPGMQWDWDLVPSHLRCKRCEQVRPYRMRLRRFVRSSPFYGMRAEGPSPPG